VAEAVVVAAPDDRFGERVIGVVRIRAGQQVPSRDGVRTHFEGVGMARQKWPEELRVVEDYPRTASGKVQKYLVRQQVRSSQG
jgi:acyl-CoA synthetase (AMP-forming)/AMP-acid ligase II